MNDRDFEVLNGMTGAKEIVPAWKGWLTPMFLGGRDASHHSATLNKLRRHGLVERKRRAGWSRPSWLYRITATGRKALAAAKRERESAP